MTAMFGDLTSAFHDSLSEFEVDKEIIRFFQWGMMTGIFIITTLIFFPGTNEASGKSDVSENEEGKSIELEYSTHGEILADGIIQDSNATTEKYGGFSSEEEFVQFKKFLERRRGQGEGSWTPHQQMNFVVYLILIGTAFILLSAVYSEERNFLRAWIVHNFPRESRVLGFSSS